MTQEQVSALSSVDLHLVNTVEKAGDFLTWLSQRRPQGRSLVELEGMHYLLGMETFA